MYPYETVEDIQADTYSFYDKPQAFWLDDIQAGQFQYLNGTLREPLVEIETEPEELAVQLFEYLDGTLKEPLVDIETEPEELEVATFEYESGTLDTVLIQYTYWDTLIDEESLEGQPITYIDGTLT